MKIKVVSSHPQQAESLAELVRQSDPGLDVVSTSGTLGELPLVVNGSRPGLLVVDGVDLAGLEVIERLALSHPDVDTIIISDDASAAFLLQAMRAGVREVLPAPINAQAVQAAVRRIARKRAAPAQARLGQVLAFVASKGGSGATFLATSLASCLAARGDLQVAVIDLNLQFGDAALFLSDTRPASNVAEVARNMARLDADLLRSAMLPVRDNLMVLPSPDDLAHAFEVKAAHVGAIIKQARAGFDFVVIDVGRSMDALTLQALDQADRIFPVVQLTLPYIRDAKRLRDLFRSLDYPASKIHWLVNRHEKGGEITIEALEATLGAGVFKAIPNHYDAVAAAVNQGIPIDQLARHSPVTKALQDIARQLAPPPAAAAHKERWLGLFGGR
ncbi:MAG: CpaE family protein [Caldimonas sp.]|uniref:AAA family ATPase n=1 Tax=Caldimonas sp. TaxID=2838790 RepID=UPI00391AD970